MKKLYGIWTGYNWLRNENGQEFKTSDKQAAVFIRDLLGGNIGCWAVQEFDPDKKHKSQAETEMG